MTIVGTVASALQRLFGEVAQAAAQRTNVIQRQRCFDPMSLAKTFILGFLHKPAASSEDLAQTAAQCGVPVTSQAVDQRQSPRLVAWLKDLFQQGCRIVVASDKVMAPILERFSSVDVLDASSIRLPDALQDQYPGCGGSHGSGKAALKMQVEWDLKSGALTHVDIAAGRQADGACARQHAVRAPGSLRIADLGYFALDVFAALSLAQAYFLSRLQFGTHVRLPNGLPNGNPINLLRWLSAQADRAGGLVDQQVVLGEGERLPCRLIAWRLPRPHVERRVRKLRAELRRRKGKKPSAERLAWCGWTILVTNVPQDKLTAQEALVLYRARWQIELLFKRWKSQDLVAALRGSTVVRQMVGVWSRLLAALVQHWLVIASVWGDPTKSLSKASEAIRAFAGRLAAALQPEDWERVLADLCSVTAKTCRRNRRSKPGTFELLNDIGLLEFELT